MNLKDFSNITLKLYTQRLFDDLSRPGLYFIIAEQEKQRELEQLKKDLSSYTREELINACIGSFIFSYDSNKEKEKLEKELKNFKEDAEKIEQIKKIIGYYIDEEY